MKLLLLLGPTLDWYFADALDRLAGLADIEVVGALVEVRRGGFRLRAFRRELSKGRGGYTFVMAASNLQRTVAREAEPSEAFARARGLPAWPVEDLYAPGTIELIRSLEPDAIFRTGFGIIREPVLSLAPHGVLSYHHGDIRRYRGQPVAFWELYNGEREMGVTLQVLNSRLDGGTVIARRTVPIRRDDTWHRLERRAYESGLDMLAEACSAIARDVARPTVVPPEELGQLYTLPNLRQWSTLQGKVLVRRALAARR